MKTQATQQEILLTTESSFAHREWSEIEDATSHHFSNKEEFEEACWNGAVTDMLPEIDAKLILGKKLWLWQIRETKSFLELELSDYPTPKEKYFSIDPYSFLDTKSAN